MWSALIALRDALRAAHRAALTSLAALTNFAPRRGKALRRGPSRLGPVNRSASTGWIPFAGYATGNPVAHLDDVAFRIVDVATEETILCAKPGQVITAEVIVGGTLRVARIEIYGGGDR